MEQFGHLLVLATALFLASIFPTVMLYPLQEANEVPMVQGNPEAELKDPRVFVPLPQSNMDARMRLYLLSWLQNVGALQNLPTDRMKAKRTCRLNAGLSHSCDYKDTLDAIHEGMYLGSDMTPGRK